MNTKKIILLAVAFLLLAAPLLAAQHDRLTPKPMEDRVSARSLNMRSGQHTLPLITWGADIATVAADMQGYFDKAGLDLKLVREDVFSEQVRNSLAGETPYLRGTIGMINDAAVVFEKAGVPLQVFYTLSRSTGGDCIVVRDNIKKPKDFEGKTVALQLDGPHADFIANYLVSNGVNLAKVDFVYYRNLTIPNSDSGKIDDPVTAFRDDKKIAAVCCIIPDGLELSSGGTVGTGSSGSVKKAKILFSSASKTNVIYDVYAVRSDYYKAHPDKVQALANALLQGEEYTRDVVANQKNDNSNYRALMNKSSDLVWGLPGDIANTEALLGDCTFQGYEGNLEFLTGKNSQGKKVTRNIKTLNKEIQGSFLAMGLISKKADVPAAALNFNALATGLKYATAVAAPKPKFDKKKAQQVVERKIQAEPDGWALSDKLFELEIYFEANQETFDWHKYESQFKKALEQAQTNGGALVVIEGHSDPQNTIKAQRKNKSNLEINQIRQRAKNLSQQRADAVVKSFVEFCRVNNYAVDPSQFVAVGRGVSSPKHNPPTRQNYKENRRVVFVIKMLEAEAEEFILD